MMYMICALLFAQTSFDKEKVNNIYNETKSFRALFLARSHPSIPKEAYYRAAQGEIATGVQPMPGHASKIGWGVGIFHVDIQTMWAALNNGEQHVGYTPVSFAKVIHGESCQNKRVTLMTLPIPILPDRWWVVQSDTNPELHQKTKGAVREMSWKDIDNPQQFLTRDLNEKVKDMIQIPFAQGAWVLIDLGEGYTLGEYHTWAKAGGNVPSGLTEVFVQKSVRRTMNAMEAFSKQTQSLCQFP